MSRRAWLRTVARTGAAFSAAALAPPALAQSAQSARTPIAYAPVRPETRLRFPRDHGAHPDFRTEWWYLTGWLHAGTLEFGVQVTFFRARTTHADANPSRFAPRQLLLAHAALALPGEPRLRHDQRAARTGFGLAEASDTDCALRLDGWTLARTPDDSYATRVRTDRFDIDLRLRPSGPPVLQGDAGFSRKGPGALQASHYYSRPQLAMQGTVRLGGTDAGTDAGTSTSAARELAVSGTGWFDHEWSSELLDPRAVGWDWTGLNFDDGSALMAFRIRARDGTEIWSHARWIEPGAASVASAARDATRVAPEQNTAVRFEPVRRWRSLRSRADYPVQLRLTVAGRTIELRPLLDDQELDARASTGIIYWEGAVRAYEAGREVGRGYLELTGYAAPVEL